MGERSPEAVEPRATTENGRPPVRRPNFRRSIITGVLAIAALIAGMNLGGVHRQDMYRYLAIGLTVAFVILGASAIRSASRDIQALSQTRVGPSAGSVLGYVATTVGYLVLVFGLLALLNVNPASLLVGGALIGAIVGLAAQQTLGNYFAGLVLLLARPYVPGERITIHNGGMGGEFTGTVVDAGVMYTVIMTDVGEVKLPNSGVLASAIGPPTEEEAVEPEADEAAAAVADEQARPTQAPPTP
jgi:small-conductance mechanosensitive channel